VLQCVAVCCSALQFVAVCCSVLQRVAVLCWTERILSQWAQHEKETERGQERRRERGKEGASARHRESSQYEQTPRGMVDVELVCYTVLQCVVEKMP